MRRRALVGKCESEFLHAEADTLLHGPERQRELARLVPHGEEDLLDRVVRGVGAEDVRGPGVDARGVPVVQLREGAEVVRGDARGEDLVRGFVEHQRRDGRRETRRGYVPGIGAGLGRSTPRIARVAPVRTSSHRTGRKRWSAASSPYA